MSNEQEPPFHGNDSELVAWFLEDTAREHEWIARRSDIAADLTRRFGSEATRGIRRDIRRHDRILCEYAKLQATDIE